MAMYNRRVANKCRRADPRTLHPTFFQRQYRLASGVAALASVDDCVRAANLLKLDGAPAGYRAGWYWLPANGNTSEMAQRRFLTLT
jgi:hypothetical protein